MKKLSDLRGDAEEMAQSLIARWVDRERDWGAFGDGQNPGYQRMQVRYVGGGGSGKHDDPKVIPPGAFTVTAMGIPPGQGTSLHAHAVDEAFFILEGEATGIIIDESGNRAETRLSKWDCFCRPAGVIGGLYNDSMAPCYVQVILDATQTVPVARQAHGYAEENSALAMSLAHKES
jgi:mannose-6-phosphate isomerase-like protein (cupin superfamily)